MQKACLLLVVLFGTVGNASAQEWFDYLNGPFHRPTAAFDEVGNNPMPLLMVYTDKQVEMYIPDFTTDYGLVERPAVYKLHGTYTFVLYTYYKDSFKTNRSLVTGNARTGEVNYHSMDDMGGIWGSLIKYDKNNPLPPKLAAAVSAYVKLLDSLSNSKEVKDAVRKMSPPSTPTITTRQSAEVGANGVYKIGGGVSAPVLVSSGNVKVPERFTNANSSGNVEVDLIVDENGNPSHVSVLHGVDMELDEKVVEAVRQDKFKPAMLNGKPVKVDLYINFKF